MLGALNLSIFLLLSFISLGQQESTKKVYATSIDASSKLSQLEHFWESTGFCPPDPHKDFYKFVSTNDMAQNLAYIGSVPNQGIKQVRIHWLLDLISMETLPNGTMSYVYKHLDVLLHMLLKHGLKPGFEIMGNPSGFFKDFDDAEEIYAWRDMVKALAVHLIERYGITEVSSWNFESWNEPQNKQHFDGLHVSTQGYLNYYDASSEGLYLANPALRFGGPATGNPLKHPIFWTLIDHCYQGKNFFSHQKRTRLDYISFHIKGGGHSISIINDEALVLKNLTKYYPEFSSIPIYNDEADPLVGWSKEEDWRADVYYAAVVAKIISQHQGVFRGDTRIQYKLLSNDNAFISYPPAYFTQRTLLARFQMNTSHPRKIEFIRKSVLSIMGLLSLLGNQELAVNVSSSDQKASTNKTFGVIASSSGSSPDDLQLSVLFYNSNDTSNTTGLAVVYVCISGIPVFKDAKFVLYQMDNERGNPHGIWVGIGRPLFPTEKEFAKMRANEEPVRTRGPSTVSVEHPDQFKNTFVLPLPGVALLVLCAKLIAPPAQVTNVSLLLVSPQDVLVTWKHKSAKCIKTYEILFSAKHQEGPYSRINPEDQLFHAYLHHKTRTTEVTPGDTRGWYRVIAVDYWDRGSKPSTPGRLGLNTNIDG
ncbi:alpha-L-iduronidase isoform X2 [Nematostella vectensis]|uniref:alpha-L-iduronidase isoform X2 n=1 Tax=Nematostella vectensis TaxID=45351 RepID=UPI0020776F2E|nr:alpha-L-iduronidase isoform X2 [Nematostella vectensis]